MAERFEAVDALRGFALLGICLVNAPVIAGVHSAGAMAWVITVLFSSKFYLLFSFLFGYAFTLQQRAAENGHVPFAARHARRLLGLFVLGLAHAVLLFPGDILMTYAVLGLPLYLLHRCAARTAVRAALLATVATAGVFLTIGLYALQMEPAGQSAAEPAASAYTGGPLDVVRAHLGELRTAFTGAVLYSGHLFAAFLAGLAAGKHRVLENPGRYAPRLRRILVTGLVVGLPGSVVMAVCEHGPFASGYFYIGRAVGILTAPALTAAYGSALLLLLGSRHGGRVRRLLAPAGRMALTNYLLQSLVLALVFTGYGFALYGRVAPAMLTAGCVLLYGAQLLLSAQLMARTRYGPAERVLRRITYGFGPAARQRGGSAVTGV